MHSGGVNPLRKLGVLHGEREVRAYNGDLGAEPSADSRSRTLTVHAGGILPVGHPADIEISK